MSRREAAGLLILALAVLLGRLVRTTLLLGTDGAWRDPLWLEQVLPPLSEPTPGAPPRPVLTGKLDPNRCSEDSLTLLPGIGPVIAARIAAVRRRGVHFASAEDLRQVRGIGPVAATRIAPHLYFGTPAAASADCTVTRPDRPP
jgi:DNA uptake protein ComE-like DNA-binding protein